MKNEITLEKISEIIKAKNNFYILTHIHPDGDAIGSAYALAKAIQKMGKNAKVLCSNPIPEKLKFICNYVKNQKFESETIITVDLADTTLLGDKLEKYKNKIDICIDHHVSNTNYAQVTHVRENCAATCEIIYNLINTMDVPIDKEIAECLYIGIATDTGCFKYPSTTAETHKITAELIKSGIELAKINKNLFSVISKQMLKIKQMIYDILEYFFDGKCAITYVSLNMMSKAGVTDSELEGLAAIPIEIEDVQIGITIRQKPGGINKVSVRSAPGVNANELCALFGGGGHAQASGFNLKGDIPEVKLKIIDAVKTHFGW